MQGTVRPAPNFNPNHDAEVLKKAMKGFGCDDRSVMNVLCCRTNAQRQQIRMVFKTMYGKDIVKELISELRGNLEDVIVALMYTPAEYDARELRNAMQGAGTNESVLIEIMCSRTNAEIHALKEAFRRLYRRDLERDLASETSFHFKRLMVSLSVGGRDESQYADPARAKHDAKALYQAGEKKLGTDESTFNAIIASQNFTQLQMVFEEYRKISGHDLEKAILREFSGDLETGLLSIVKCVKNRPAYFAERLYKSMKGLGTNDSQLIRVTVSRCEMDMVQIKQEFQKKFGKTLESFIAGDTSGKYKDALLMLVRGN
jgi:annexin A7/11